MKHLIFLVAVSVFAASSEVRADSLSRLFEASKIWNEPAKPIIKQHSANKKKKSIKRSFASQAQSLPPVIVNTYVYDSNFSFSKNRADLEPGRDVASVAMKGRVIAVRRELSLTELSSKGVEQEYVVNAGSRLGLTKGTKLKVYRTLPVVDPFNGNKQHELKVDFAILEVVFVEEDVAVAQLDKLTNSSVGPYVGLRGILVGDYVSLR